MSKEIKVNWIDEMIEREAIPRNLREGTVEDFALKYGIDPSTYYYQSRKKENQRKVLNIALSLAKKGIPEVLEKLRERAEEGDTKSIEMYLKYILEMRDKYDMTSDGKSLIVNIDNDIADKNDINTSTENNS